MKNLFTPIEINKSVIHDNYFSMDYHKDVLKPFNDFYMFSFYVNYFIKSLNAVRIIAEDLQKHL